MDSKIKNVVFDLGGVLINLDFDNCLNAFRKAGFQDIEKQACQFRGKGFFSQFELGEISPEEFRKAISWAYHAGYINGISETEFDPNGKLTREATMRILFAYNGGQSGMEEMFIATYDAAYKDSNSISTWARDPMYWGIYQGYITGTGTDTLTPQGIATRAQLAKIMMSYLESLEK